MPPRAFRPRDDGNRLDSHEWLAHPGSVGRTRKGAPHILDETWAELPANRSGRIYFSGVAPFRYFGDPEKTAERTSPQGYQTLGDIGYVDDQGFMYLTDRMDDMIISGGVNVYPQEVEAALLELPAVVDAAVVGAADAEYGERPVAFVVGSGDLAPEELTALLQSHCADRLGGIKSPARFIIVEHLPRTPTGNCCAANFAISCVDGPGQAKPSQAKR